MSYDMIEDYNTNDLLHIKTKYVFKSKVTYKDISNLLSGLSNHIDIINKILNLFLEERHGYLIDEYIKYDNIPFEYNNIIKLDKCLSIIIKNTLKLAGGIVITQNIDNEINKLISNLYLNTNNCIIYEKVNKIQEFIHITINKKELNAELMKIALSACRLHLEILNLKNISIESISYIIFNAKVAHTIPTSLFRKNIKDDNHLKSILQFLETDDLNKLNKIINIDQNMPLKEFKMKLISIFNSKLLIEYQNSEEGMKERKSKRKSFRGFGNTTNTVADKIEDIDSTLKKVDLELEKTVIDMKKEEKEYINKLLITLTKKEQAIHLQKNEDDYWESKF